MNICQGAADTNGFCIGLSFENIETTTGGDEAIPTASRDFEVRIKRGTDPYEYISPTVPNTPQVSGTSPYSYLTVAPGGGIDNDHIIFEKKENIIRANIWKTNVAGGSATELFSYTLTDEEHKKDLYPYIAVFGAKADAVVGHPNITVQSIMNPFQLDQLQETNDNYAITGQVQGIQGGNNCFDAITNMANIVPA